jgi:hypothetical protein
MRFKTERIHNEFIDLQNTKNKKLGSILNILDEYCQIEFGKDICLTEVFRTPEEQVELYRKSASHPKTSPHMYWKAVDVRSSDWTLVQRNRMLQVLNSFTYTSGQGKVVSFVHDVGNGLHFHVQAD